MFNNTTSYPLLLIQSLHATGILASLVQGHQETEEAIERAKSYFLVFATVSSCLTFAVGPRLIDSEHAPEGVGKKEEEDREEDEGEEEDVMEIGGGVNEESGLLTSRSSRVSLMSVSFFPSKPRDMAESMVQDRRPTIVAEKRRHHMSDRTRWWLLFLYDFLNAPLLGAVLGAIIGLVPAFHRAFFADTEDGGFFSAWLTASLTSVGSLFVPLPVVVAGVSLYTAMEKTNKGQAGGTPWLTTLFVLVVRFAIWPVISIAVIYTLAHRTNILGDDPMLWFTMMLMPTGPPAMKLITMVEVSDADEEDEHKISKLLTVSAALVYLLIRELIDADILYYLPGSGVHGCGYFACCASGHYLTLDTDTDLAIRVYICNCSNAAPTLPILVQSLISRSNFHLPPSFPPSFLPDMYFLPNLAGPALQISRCTSHPMVTDFRI